MTTPNRRKLWEHQDYQCPILGTCLSMGELRKLARKLGVVVKPGATDYELHTFFVRECRQETPLSAYVNKYLDKKYRKELRLFAKASEETALAAMWGHSVGAGDIPGPFWALMSHPDAGNLLLNKAFGEIHMLSHLMGAANRADLKRLGKLERRLDGVSQALSRVQAARRAQKLEWALRVKDLEDRLEAERADRLKLSRQVREAALPRPDMAAQANPDVLRLELEGARNEARRQAAIIEELYTLNTALRARLEETQADLDRAELELVRAMPCAEGGGCRGAEGRSARLARPDSASHPGLLEQPLGNDGPSEVSARSACDGRCSGNGCPCPALTGKSVLYVGGRCNLVRHYREMVERLGLRFHHHDGGLESSPAELHGKLATADVVICPVDCVSHEACQTVKKACKHRMKPFVMLRSSGLSALARSLDELGRTVN
jgi:hypothetical protein